MAGFFTKILRAEPSPPIDDEDDDANILEYSFAIEYRGPVINLELPRAVPIDVDKIPTAITVVQESQFNNLSLPIIQPIVKKSRRDSNLGAKAIVRSSPEASEVDPDSPCSTCIDSSGELESKGNNKYSAKFSDRTDSYSTLGISHMFNGELEGEVDSLEGDIEEESQDYVNPINWESVNSGLTTSSEIFSCKEEESDDNTQPHHEKKPSTVTFRDTKSNSIVDEEEESSYNQSMTESFQVQPKAERKGKKGSCYRCLEGNRLTEKEVCIVCGAKYCSNCVLRAMGSMPEGRKCVTCIGFRIDESRRDSLGKCSRMLKRLLTEMEVKQLRKNEIECVANKLPSKLVFINGEPLRKEKLAILQNCSNPPKKLKPGSYWYDKVSGFWGKEGREPCQIISPQLEVGGHMKRNASNGNTNVLINNREITQKELFMLKMAGVPCEGQPSFWVSADGSYQEEGMKNVKGKIWDNRKMKLVCSVLSLPIPSNSTKSGAEDMKRVDPNCPEQKRLYKLLLVGHHKSGTSTIFKQAKLLYNVPFSKDERQNIKLMIQSNLYRYLGILLEARERFEQEMLVDKGKRCLVDQSGPSSSGQICDKTTYSIGLRLKAFSDWLLNVMVSGNLEAIFPAATREYAPYTEELWKDAAIQATYTRRNEIELLPRVASYFLNRATDISRTDYEPSDNDILYAEGIGSSNGLSDMEFSFPKLPQDQLLDDPYQHDPSLRYQLIRVHASSLGEKCKWLEMFEDVDIVLFCVSLTDYDEYYEPNIGDSINKMIASRQLFESIITHPTLNKKNFFLILNKFDLFEEKIEQVPLNRCEWFHDFHPLSTRSSNASSSNVTNPTLAQRAFQYVAVKFKRLFHSHTSNKLFVSATTGMEPENVNEALRYAREVLKWEKEEPDFNMELSSTSIEASSSS